MKCKFLVNMDSKTSIMATSFNLRPVRVKFTTTMKTLLQDKIQRKEDELKDLQEIKAYTGVLADQLDQIEKKLDEMAGGAESVALVLSSWQNIMNSVSLASLGLLNYSKKDYNTKCPFPEPLVRINLHKDNDNAPGAGDEL